jgi:RNA polymerase sigma-70 factor (ECF subfamily)
VLAAADSRDGRAALQTLCEAYWLPLYGYVRRRGYSVHESQDLTQSFFAGLLERKGLAVADPGRGRFRSFLLTALRNFLHNEWDRATTEKRGGGKPVLSLDFTVGESRLHLEPVHHETPELLFDREWAFALLDRVMQRLGEEHTTPSKQRGFQTLRPFLTGAAGDYPTAARELDMTEASVRQAVSRLRKRYRELLREEVAQTVGDPADVEEELQQLVTLLSS